MARPGSPFASFRQPRRGVLAAVAAPTPSAPATPTTPFPIDTGVALRSVLSWVAVGATKVDIYLDTVNPPVARAVSGHYVGTTYTPTLLPATTYYWQIVAINDGGQAPGPVWSFTTPRATDVLVEMAGELVTARAPIDTLTVREVLSASPNEASLFFRLTAPQGGQSVLIGLGSFDDDDLIFGGEVQAIDNSYVGTPGNQAYPITLIDQTFRINKRRPFGSWVDTSASIIGRYLVAVFAPTFTSNGIQDGLPNISINFDGSADFMSCLGQLATAISTAAALGRARVDYGRDVHLYLGSEGIAPDVIDADHPVVPNDPPIVFSVDHSQIRTRVYGKGAGSTVPCDVATGETILPLADVAFFEPVGGQAIGSTTAGAAQTEIVTYTGVQLGGGGSLVGPGAAPTVAPAGVTVIGTELGIGTYKYGYTDVTASGESLPSPLATVVSGVLSPPSTSPSLGAPSGGGSLSVGVYGYAFSDVVGASETVPGPVSHVTIAPLAFPGALTWNGNTHFGQLPNGTFPGNQWAWAVSFVTAGGETVPGTRFTWGNSGGTPNTVFLGPDFQGVPIGPAGVTARKIWRTRVQADPTSALGAAMFLEGTIADNTTTTWAAGNVADASLGAAAPTHGTAAQSATVAVSAIAAGPTGVTGRKLYRTVADGSQLKLLATFADNTTTTFTDSTADGSLGANALSVGTASARRVNLTGIATGPSTTTSRKIYRTVVNGTQLKLLTTIGDNATTTFADSTADGSLGANAPISDTSGLTQPSGQVNAGSTALPTATATTFQTNGGWVILSGGQTVRYTGITANMLTGIPASGVGSITTTVLYGSPALPAPALVGLNNLNGLRLAIAKGSAINLWVQRDDLDAQAALGALELDDDGNPTDGIREYTVTDARRTDSLNDLCDSNLAIFSRPIVSVAYQTTRKTHAGNTVSINLAYAGGQWGLVGDFTIQAVDLAFRNGVPRWTVKAASVAFTLSELLRRAVIG